MSPGRRQGMKLSATIGIIAACVGVTVSLVQVEFCVPPWQVQSVAKAAQQHQELDNKLQAHDKLQQEFLREFGAIRSDLEWIKDRLKACK